MVIAFLTLLASLSAHAGLGSYTAAELNQIIQSKKITKIEELLRHISDDGDVVGLNIMTRDPEIFTDLYHPRVIGTTDSQKEIPKSIIAFTGKKGQRGYERLQVLEFDSVRGILVPHEFTFPAELGQSGPVTWSEKPDRCLRCHSDQRMFGVKPTYENAQIIPIWDAYSGSPGFLGDEAKLEIDDGVAVRTLKVVDYLNTTERYRILKIPSKPIDPETLNHNPYKVVEGLQDASDIVGEQLNQWNVQRVYHFFKSQPNYQAWLPVLRYALVERFDENFVHYANSIMNTDLSVAQLERRSLEINRQNVDYLKSRDARRIRSFYLPEKIDPELRKKYQWYFDIVTESLDTLEDSRYFARLHWILEEMGFKNKRLSSIFEQGELGRSPLYGLLNELKDLLIKDYESSSCAKALK